MTTVDEPRIQFENNDLKPVGHGRMLRKEDPRFVRGRGRYCDDVQLPGMLHLAILRSPVAQRLDLVAGAREPHDPGPVQSPVVVHIPLRQRERKLRLQPTHAEPPSACPSGPRRPATSAGSAVCRSVQSVMPGAALRA